MGLGIVVSRGLSVRSSSNYEPSHRGSSTSTTSTLRPPDTASRSSRASTVRSSTSTAVTSTSKLIRSASTSRQSTSASLSSTLRPPTYASRTTKASDVRASTVTSATSTSQIVRSASTASTLRQTPSTAATSTTSLLSRSSSKSSTPSSFSTAASRLLWGRPPPGHSTLQPSQISCLTHTLSLPLDTPMLSSLVGALGVPLSRSQFSPVPSCFCDAHFWFERRYIDELTEVIAHEIGPQLEKLRSAPKELTSKKTARLLSTLQPYKDIFTTISDTSSIVSMQPACPACTLSCFFQNLNAVTALTTCVTGRKHKVHPWPVALAWLDPCPGKGVDWEAKWRTQGKHIGHDRIRVQRWRRANRQPEQTPEQTQIPGHGPGKGCDFCDSLRLERADDAELDAAIAEEEEGEEGASAPASDEVDRTTPYSDSATLRAIEEESIIKAYARSTTDSVYPPSESHFAVDYDDRTEEQRKRAAAVVRERERDDQERARRASDWARSYQCLVGRGPESRTTLQFQQFGEVH